MTISAITRHDPPVNQAGLQEVFFILQKDVTIPYSYNLFGNNVEVVGSIGSGYGVNRLYFTPRSEKFSEQTRISAHGKLYSYQLAMRVPALRQEVDATLALIGSNKVFIAYKDKNGHIRIHTNMRLEEQSVINATNNYYTLSFSAYSKYKAKYWSVDDISTNIVLGGGGGNTFIFNQTGTTSQIYLVDDNSLRLNFGGKVYDIMIIPHHNDTQFSLGVKKIE